MALFTRRVLQQCINDATTFASRKKIREWVKKLNDPGYRDYIPTEWEVVLLRTLSTIGELTHPPERPPTPTVDVLFRSSDHDVDFAADIVAISDRGARENQRIYQLQLELDKRFMQLGLRHGGFSCRAEQLSVHSKGQRPEVLLPKRDDFDRVIFNEDFDCFVERIRTNPEREEVHRVVHKNPRTVASIFYNPRRQWHDTETDHLLTPTNVIDSNVLYRELQSKAKQLEGAGWNGRRGIIVCDGGARILTERHNWYSFCNAEVVQHFLAVNGSVDFVLTLGLEDQTTFSALRQKLVHQLFAAREEPWMRSLARLFGEMVARLPAFDQSPENAYRDLANHRGTEVYQIRSYGGWGVSADRDRINKIKISARTLLSILAGQTSDQQFAKHFSLGNDVQVFKSMLRAGRLITEASVNQLPNEDDDEIVFTFGEPDAAARPFVVPRAHPRNQ